MKSNAKSKIIILIALGILFALAPRVDNNLSFINGNSDVTNIDNENLKISAVSGKIHIINNSGWVDFRNAGYCTGNGTYSEPYVIEDLIIDAGNSGSCILIENSNVYFKIENCTLYNSEWENADIKLLGVSNGLLINNNMDFNDYLGIYLLRSDNNTISGNTVNNNYFGIVLEESNNNSVLGNTANSNGEDGINLSSCNNITVSGNIMNDCGLHIYGSFEELRSHNIDTSNLVNGKPLYYYSNEINLGSSNFTNGGQVILVNVNNSLISNLNVSRDLHGFPFALCSPYASYSTNGISLYYCNNNTVLGNTANYNYWAAISLSYCNNNTVSGNTANYNDRGIMLEYSNDTTISGNTANYNWNGIFLEYSNNDIISGNTANYNNRGIRLEYSNNDIISGNTVNYNYNGISLEESNNNSVSGNIANSNGEDGINLSSCNNITVSGNIMNGCGLSIYGSFETISSHNIDTSNLVNGKPLYYYTNEVNLGPNNFTNAGQVILVNCNDSLISNLNISNSSRGISLHYCNNNTISGNTANYNNRGIRLEYSNNNTVSENTANNNTIYEGIYLRYSDNNTISGNTANYNWIGIYLSSCNNNTISGNTANYNVWWSGIMLEYSNNSMISGNTANNNDYVGISLEYSNNNTVSGNTANHNYLNGIWLSSSNYNLILGNIVNNNVYGIYLFKSNYNLISGNQLIGNHECIIEVYCEGNVIQDNDCRTLPPSFNYLPIILIITIIIVGVSVFILFLNRKLSRKIQEELDY